MAALVPHAVGTLEKTPFGELLVRALDQRLTGTLVLEETGGARHGVYLEGGTARKAKLGSEGPHLGDVLVETGAITTNVHEATLARALQQHVLYGQLLLGEGRISEHTLGLGLRDQLERQLIWLFRQPEGTHYGYFEGRNLLSAWGAAARIEPSTLAVLWRGIAEKPPLAAIDGALARVSNLRMALHPGLPPEHFAFMGRERRTVELLTGGPKRLAELFDAEPQRETEIRRVLYFLLITRSIDLGVPSAPPLGLVVDPFVAPPPGRLPTFASAPSPPPAARRDSPPSIPPAIVHTATLKDELRKRLEKPPRTHYEVLGIPEDAPPRQIQAAFFLLSKRWHPDRLGPEAAELREGAARVYDGIAQAYHVLADPALRTAYDDELSNGNALASGPATTRALNADLAFQKAESFLARGNLEAAEREARVAWQQDPQRAEHIALVAWLDALKPNFDERQIGIAFNRALRAAEGNLKVHWYRGLFLKRTGRHAAALQEFRFVSERDTRHIDAAREVRIYEQRLQNSPKDRLELAPEAVAERSAWSRLFKRRN